jgi:hypothetical protein
VSIATVVIDVTGGNVLPEFHVDQKHSDQTEKIVTEIVRDWSITDRVAHGIIATGKTFGRRIVVRLARSSRDAARSLHELKVELEKRGLTVYPGESRGNSPTDNSPLTLPE